MTTQGELPDIVERLRDATTKHVETLTYRDGHKEDHVWWPGTLLSEAADLIDRLRATPPGSTLEREDGTIASVPGRAFLQYANSRQVPDDTWGAFGFLVSCCSSGAYKELIEKGKTDAQARNAIIHSFLDMAAGESCRIARREGREPNSDKWQKATQTAFSKAVERTASVLKSDEQSDPVNSPQPPSPSPTEREGK